MWATTSGSHRREQAPSTQLTALGWSDCLCHQKEAVISCQCPGPQVRVHGGLAPETALGEALQLPRPLSR